MDKPKYLKNTLRMVEGVLNKSLKSIFNIDGKVSVKSFDKDNNFDYQSPFAVMYFKRIKKSNIIKDINSPVDLANYLKTQFEKEEYNQYFSKVDVQKNFLLFKLTDSYL